MKSRIEATKVSASPSRSQISSADHERLRHRTAGGRGSRLAKLIQVVLLWAQLAWVAGLLVACLPASTAPATTAPTARPEITSSSPSATEVPATETPSPAPTPLPVPSMTPLPTQTTAPPPSTVVPTTVTSKATPEFLATSASQSPDGQWLAESSLSYVIEQGMVQGYDTRLQVSRFDDPVAWTFVEYIQGAGLGFAIPEVHRWSVLGSHLYFTNRPVPDGCAWFVDGSDLHRADLTTGEVAEVMPPLARTLSLSPDETTVAYFPWGPSPDLVLRDLVSGNERNLAWETPFDNPGNIVWSPDGGVLALTLSADTCFPTRSHTIVKVEVLTLEPTALVENDDRLLTIVSWPQPERLLLQDRDGRSWWLNSQTGEITETE